MSFADHFSGHAADYARFRPHYPPVLFSFLAGLAPTRALAWDCGTGNGQAAVGLAEHFAAVVATDPSSAQLAEATAHPRVTYRVGAETGSGLADASVDLVSAAQALHWFDCEAFYAEVRRVLRPRGVLAVWTYGIPRVSPAIDPLIRAFHTQTVGPYWPSERRHVDAGYVTLLFPFPELGPPLFELKVDLELPQFVQYVGTWSAVQRYRSTLKHDPVPAFANQLLSHWGSGGAALPVTWPLVLRVGRMGG